MINEEDINEESPPMRSIPSHNSCVDFSFSTETANTNTRKLTRLNGLFHYLADRRTGGLRADKLHDLIISAGCSDFTTLKLESFLFPKLKVDGVEILRKQKRLFGKTEKTEVDVRVISRGPFLSIFKDETMQSVTNLVQSAASNKAKKGQWRLDRSDQSSCCSHDVSLDRYYALKDSRTVKTEPAFVSNSKGTKTKLDATEEASRRSASEKIEYPKNFDDSPRISKHAHFKTDTDESETSMNKARRRKKGRSRRKKKPTRSKEQQIHKTVPKENKENLFNNYNPNNEALPTQRHVGSCYTYPHNKYSPYHESKGSYSYNNTHFKGYAEGNGRTRRKRKSVVENCLEAHQYPINMDDQVWRDMLVQQQQHAYEKRRPEANGELCSFGGFANFVKTLLAPRNDIIH